MCGSVLVQTPPPHKGLRLAHESNPSALAAKLDKIAYTPFYLYRESHSRGRNAHTLLKSRYQLVRIKASVTRASTGTSLVFNKLWKYGNVEMWECVLISSLYCRCVEMRGRSWDLRRGVRTVTNIS